MNRSKLSRLSECILIIFLLLLRRLRLEALLVSNLAVLLPLLEVSNCNNLKCVWFHEKSDTDRDVICIQLTKFKIL